jgi:two-component system response regulator AtoC
MAGKKEPDKTNLLYDLLKDATRRSDLKGIFHVILRGARKGMGAGDGLVVQPIPEKGNLMVKVKTQGKFRKAEKLLSLSRGPVKQLAEVSGSVVRRKDAEMFYPGSQAQLVTPIPIGMRDSGLLVLEAPEVGAFSEENLEFLSKLIEQSTPMIRAMSTAESSKRELDCLWDVKRRIVTPTDLDITELNTLLGKILHLALARTKTQNGIICMVDEKTGDMVTSTKAALGDLIHEVPEKLKRRKTGRASGIVFWVLDNNQPYITTNIDEDPNYIPLFKGIKSSLAVPISFQDRCIGVIVVESPEPNAFTQEDQDVLKELSKNVIILVRRAQLYEATREADKSGKGVMIRGLSPEWEEVEKRVERAADTNAIVILRGESGTGKELVARSIHFNSRRKDGKLVVVNSAAIPDTLLESSLFGHVKGAYTGATYDRLGEFEKAHKGTIFLDEIGDLGLPLQAKLLRVLEAGEIQKLGSNEDAKKVDVRVIAATSRNLEEMMEKREFREDLYFRLHVVPIWLPPLRVYKKSIPGMVKAFVRDAAKSYERPVEGISAEALDLLIRHEYPGNVRELKNVIEQSVIMATGKTITIDDLSNRLTAKLKKPALAPDARDFKSMKKQVLEKFELEYLAEVLTEAKGNISKASDISGINRVNFYKLLRRHELDPAGFR